MEKSKNLSEDLHKHINITSVFYCNILQHFQLTKNVQWTDQPLCKHYRVRLDLDGLRTPRYLRITNRATKRVSLFSLCCDQKQETFVNLCHIVANSSLRKNGHPLKTISHHQFLTKYSNRLTDQPLRKHYNLKADLDCLRKARYLPITE